MFNTADSSGAGTGAPAAGAAAGNAPAAAAAAGNAPASAAAQPPAGPSEAEITARAEAALLKRLGVSKIEEAEAGLKSQRERADAEKTALERLTGKVDELAPKARRAEALEASIREYLTAEEAAVPKEKRGLLDLAPPAEQPEARLKWIASAKAKGLFAVEAAPPAGEKKPEEKPANTRAGGTPPASGGDAPAKRPAQMTDAEFKVWKTQRDAQRQAR